MGKDIDSAAVDEFKDRIEKGILDMGLLVEPVDVSKYEIIRIPCAAARFFEPVQKCSEHMTGEKI